MIILNGKSVAEQEIKNLKPRVEALGFKPRLTIFQVGNNPASNKYISYKFAQAQILKISTKLVKLELNVQEQELINLIKTEAEMCDGLIVQLPLPKHFDQQRVLNSVPPAKDIDGLNQNNNVIKPATPLGIIDLLTAYGFEIKNQVVAVIGQSNLVGKPLALMFEKLGAKMVYRLDKTTGITQAKEANIVVVAIGKPKFIKAQDLNQTAVVIDVGINEIADGQAMKNIVGDVDFDNVKNHVKALSPVPNGVGPMTISALLSNLITICELKALKF